MNLNIDPIKAAIAPYMLLIKVGMILVLGATLFIGGCNRGADKWEGKYDNEVAAHKADNAAHKATLDTLAELTKATEAKAKAASEAVKADQLAANKRYEDATHEAKRNADALAAALRAGKQRLSATWTCPAAGSTGSSAAASSGQAGSSGQYDSVARIVAAADADAAAMNLLWDGWMADRKAVIDAGCAVVAP